MPRAARSTACFSPVLVSAQCTGSSVSPAWQQEAGIQHMGIQHILSRRTARCKRLKSVHEKPPSCPAYSIIITAVPAPSQKRPSPLMAWQKAAFEATNYSHTKSHWPLQRAEPTTLSQCGKSYQSYQLTNSRAESPWQVAITVTPVLKPRKFFKSSEEAVKKERSEVTIPESIQVVTGWHLVLWFSQHRGWCSKIGLNDLGGLFQSK